MLTNGNLVILCNNGIIWSTKTAGKGVVEGMYFQGDGYVVLRTANGVAWKIPAIGEQLKMQNDGNLILYGGGNAMWSSKTYMKCAGKYCVPVYPLPKLISGLYLSSKKKENHARYGVVSYPLKVSKKAK